MGRQEWNVIFFTLTWDSLTCKLPSFRVLAMAVADHRQNMLVWFDLLMYFGGWRAVVKRGCGLCTN